MRKDDPWVGTWRPHRPRGLIAAQIGCPGPKYALPGLTGAFQHDPTKPKAPAFSFGARHKVANTDCSPGPKYLLQSTVTRYGQVGTPAFSLHGRLELPASFHTPGPAQYFPEHSKKLIFRATPAYSLSGRHKEMTKNQIPGEKGTWDSHLHCICTEKKSELNCINGCEKVYALYRILIFLLLFNLKIFMSSFKFYNQTKMSLPLLGPAAYMLPPILGTKGVTTLSAPSSTLIGRTQKGSFFEDLKKTPGPAAYNAVDPYFSRPKPPQCTLKGRNFPPNKTTQTPGPGSYFPERTTFTKPEASGFSFGLRHSQYTVPLMVKLDEY
ncbi:hypothetical protein ATANTOWER_026761 [Ataeniobius toweri]|uniref:Uncharacterized protein n=1 Tax=Ataeniobius toweri TaxID=208326 RepID=A0ABU7B8P4_9TELE|nr:hypothetical protein [Ataeniobius toweri]